jgi:hypothetical protein
VGWISRKHLASGRGRTFLSTSLLIELIDPGHRLTMGFEYSGDSRVSTYLKEVQPELTNVQTLEPFQNFPLGR